IRDAVEVARLTQITSGGEQNRCVTIVAAPVHAPVVARAVREVVFLLHRQRIHVGAQADASAAVVSPSWNDGDDASAAYTGVMLDLPGGELIADEARRAVLFEAEFGMRVKIAADVGERIRPAPDVV